MKKLALFDFDGTITTKDTMLEIIKYHRGKLRFLLGFLWLSPVMVFYKAGILSNWRAKEITLKHFFGGMAEEQFRTLGEQFAREVIPPLVRERAQKSIEEYKAAGDRVVLVTASSDYWVKPWADAMDIEILATRLSSEAGKITGKIDGKNCHGPEKVNRVKAEIDLSQYEEIHAYGDTSGDKEMLAMADKSFYRHFE
ncbi:MAG: HAD family hydrolase [Bacteroidota bacterium]